MSESLKNRFKSMTDEEKKEKYSRPMENNPNWKGGTSYVYCKCGKRIGFGNTFCQKCRPRSDKDNPFYGKKHSEGTRKKLSELTTKNKKNKSYEEYYGSEDKSNLEKEKRKKLVNLVVVAEGDRFGGAEEIAKIIKQRIPAADTRVCVLGHIQRGGSPSCSDRLIASHMGYYAVESLMLGRNNVMVGVINNKIHYTPLDKAVKEKQKIGQEWMKIVKILAS